MSDIIVIIWNHILSLWKQRCEEQHNITQAQKDQVQHQRLTAIIHGAYAQRERISPHISQYIFDMDINDRLKQPINALERWCKRTVPIIRQELVNHKKRTKHHLEDIRKYFQPVHHHPPDIPRDHRPP
jgi:hypothetical protein